MQIIFDRAEVRFGTQMALEPLSLALTEKRIGVIGLNGSGKTTFARMINGLVKPSTGKITVNGHDTVADAKAVLSLVGFIFQNPANQIILPIIRDDIAFGPKSRGLKGAELTRVVEDVLSHLNIAHLADRRPHELSGGELQLAALAAVMVTRPEIIIFDEPTNQLDLKNRVVVERAIRDLDENAIVISHDLDLVADFGRVLVFHAGRLVFDGPADEATRRYREIALP
ncbi:MAG TPA: cobalt ABC transporter ATP-binding protein [Rhizobium sp.]|nr:cobalt ABC transporter ATP-binding protein [Rhizobium sp.]